MDFKIFCLSLKTDTHRREHMLDVFQKIKRPVTFFDAVTPNDITEKIEKRFDKTDFYLWNINQKAVIATFISHLNMLKFSVENNINLLIIEDDIDYIHPIDFDTINFRNFDLYNVGLNFSCYSYFVSVNGSKKILNELDNKLITQAYDWELSKLTTIKKITSNQPHFIQIPNKFVSNIAPNGYVKY